jgi:hypothetical protein
MGAAIAVQPLVLLALPILLATLPLRRLPGFLIRAATPPAVLLGAAAAANWSATYAAVTSQPNSPVVDHPTLWTGLAPHMSGDAVAAGPARLFAIIVSCACAVFVRQRWRRTAPALDEFLWWIALALALRSVFEPVMVAYYLWPTLAVVLIASATSSRRLVATAFVSTAVTLVAQIGWHGPWTWWVPMLAGLSLTLFVARPSRPVVAQEVLPEPVAP